MSERETPPEQGSSPQPGNPEGGSYAEWAAMERDPLLWDLQLGKQIALLLYLVFTVAMVSALFVSLGIEVTSPPKVWVPEPGQTQGGVLIKPNRLKKCVKQLRMMDQELEHESKALWFRLRQGNKLALSSWKDWSRDWQRRIHKLRRQCPLNGKDEISLAFQKASRSMIKLQQRQAQMFHEFYGKAAWLFRDVRQGLHFLKEELR